MALFLIINILMISCGNGGPVPKEGQAATADGTIIDLAKVSEKIKKFIAFSEGVKEIDTLIKSINGLAKAIGNKVQQSGSDLANDSGSNQNGRLVSGAFVIISTVKSKATALAGISEIPVDLTTKVTEVINKSAAFLSTLQSKNSAIGKTDVDGATAKKAIDIEDKTADHGASQLKELNSVADRLLIAANKLVNDTIQELKTPTKKEATFKP